MCSKTQQLVRMMLDEEHAKDPTFYNDNFTAKQRRDVSQALEKTLWDEIVMLRTCMKNFYGVIRKRPETEEAQRLANTLQLISLSCTRLARVMQVNQALQLNQPDPMDNSINQALQNILDDWKSDLQDKTVQGETGPANFS